MYADEDLPGAAMMAVGSSHPPQSIKTRTIRIFSYELI